MNRISPQDEHIEAHSIHKNEVEGIIKKHYENNYFLGYFEADKRVILNILLSDNSRFAQGKREIKSVSGLSVNLCGKINKVLDSLPQDIKKRIIRTRDKIKADIVLIIDPERIDLLIKLLLKIPELDTWSPATLESIGRKHKRDRDPHVIGAKVFTEDEKKSAVSLDTWIKSHIRKHSKRNEKGTRIDWERILTELREKGEYELADKFIYIR